MEAIRGEGGGGEFAPLSTPQPWLKRKQEMVDMINLSTLTTPTLTTTGDRDDLDISAVQNNLLGWLSHLDRDC